MEEYREYIEKAGVLIEALPYIQEFRGAVVVVKFGGSVLEEPAAAESALRDIVFMECVGMKPVLVHGGGRAISARLAELGIETRFVNGLRYTCEQTIEVVDDVLHHRVNAGLVESLKRFGGRAQPISGKDVIQAAKLTQVNGDPVDLGFVGSVSAVDPAPIQAVVDADVVPVVTPLGAGADGHVYNINADTSACRIAQELRARKLVFLSDVPGILRDPEDDASLISSIGLDDVDGLVETGVVIGGMVPKVYSAVAALRAGVDKVHMIDARIQHSLLLEIFTDKGIGSQILP